MPSKPRPPILPSYRVTTLLSARDRARKSGRTILVSSHSRSLPTPLPQITRLLARFYDLETSLHRLCSQVDRNRKDGLLPNTSDKAAARCAITLLQDTFGL